ncbi:condensation domain-containing protein [Kitasatospora aburaviensis]
MGFTVGPELTARLEELGREHGATLFMTLLAAYQVLLGRWSGQRDFGVGTPVAGRGRPEVRDVVGFFLNTLVLRADLAGDPSFAELLGRVRADALGAYEHQDVPFGRLVEELHPSGAQPPRCSRPCSASTTGTSTPCGSAPPPARPCPSTGRRPNWTSPWNSCTAPTGWPAPSTSPPTSWTPPRSDGWHRRTPGSCGRPSPPPPRASATCCRRRPGPAPRRGPHRPARCWNGSPTTSGPPRRRRR